jgi:hypothetical protein
LPGEKPHIVPECGHSLHEVWFPPFISPALVLIQDFYGKACFTAVYGPPPGKSTSQKHNLGVCGVCRRPMKIGDGDGAKSNSAFSSHVYLFRRRLLCIRACRSHRYGRLPLYPTLSRSRYPNRS